MQADAFIVAVAEPHAVGTLLRRAAQQRTHGVRLGYSDDEGISLHFTDVQDTAQPVVLEV